MFGACAWPGIRRLAGRDLCVCPFAGAMGSLKCRRGRDGLHAGLFRSILYLSRTAPDAAQLKGELAVAAKPVKVIELHPAAIRDDLVAIDRLDLALQRDRDSGSEESTQALRDLIETVVVHPKHVDRSISLTVNGQLACLISGRPFPCLKISGGIGGSGGALRA